MESVTTVRPFASIDNTQQHEVLKKVVTTYLRAYSLAPEQAFSLERQVLNRLNERSDSLPVEELARVAIAEIQQAVDHWFAVQFNLPQPLDEETALAVRAAVQLIECGLPYTPTPIQPTPPFTPLVMEIQPLEFWTPISLLMNWINFSLQAIYKVIQTFGTLVRK